MVAFSVATQEQYFVYGIDRSCRIESIDLHSKLLPLGKTRRNTIGRRIGAINQAKICTRLHESVGDRFLGPEKGLHS